MKTEYGYPKNWRQRPQWAKPLSASTWYGLQYCQQKAVPTLIGLKLSRAYQRKIQADMQARDPDGYAMEPCFTCRRAAQDVGLE
jgi:hypothetical protein